jgi:hypothetical protein
VVDINDVMRADWGQHNVREDYLPLKDDLDGQALIWRVEDFMQLRPVVSEGVANGRRRSSPSSRTICPNRTF